MLTNSLFLLVLRQKAFNRRDRKETPQSSLRKPRRNRKPKTWRSLSQELLTAEIAKKRRKVRRGNHEAAQAKKHDNVRPRRLVLLLEGRTEEANSTKQGSEAGLLKMAIMCDCG